MSWHLYLCRNSIQAKGLVKGHTHMTYLDAKLLLVNTMETLQKLYRVQAYSTLRLAPVVNDLNVSILPGCVAVAVATVLGIPKESSCLCVLLGTPNDSSCVGSWEACGTSGASSTS
jgi:hypothetical protein